MNSLKRHKQANKTKDTIIMTKYNIVKIYLKSDRKHCSEKKENLLGDYDCGNDVILSSGSYL